MFRALHTLYHTYDQNCTKFWAFWQKKKWLTIFDKVFLEDVSASETIVWCKTINLKTTVFQCSKNHGVARLKIKLHQPWQTWSVSKKPDHFLKRVLHPLPKICIYFVLYLKIISTFLKVDIHLTINYPRNSKIDIKIK